MLPTGELLVQRVDETDKYRSYQCRAVNRLTSAPLLSVGRARFSVTGKGSYKQYIPTIFRYFNFKTVVLFLIVLIVDPVVIIK